MQRDLIRGWFFILGCLALTIVCVNTYADDWPMWRHDARRSAVTSEQLPAKLHLRWKLSLPKLEPAWPDQDRLRFDVAYEPIVVGKTLFVASPLTGSVTAYDTERARKKWRFYANGPVRFSPLAWKGKLYVVSDDGHLYCLRQSDGTVLWKFRGGPTDRMVLGNKRLISMWPARGAPVIADGTIYFGAGIWPVMGVFVYALDAETGKVVWQNDALGPLWMKQPHNSPAFAGIAPQGYLAVVGNRLLVPNGRAVPAALDRRTGKLEYYRLAKSGKVGAYAVSASEKFFASGGWLFDLDTGLGGKLLGSYRFQTFRERSIPLLERDTLYSAVRHTVNTHESITRIRAYRVALEELKDRRGNRWIGPNVRELWELDAGNRVHLKAGNTLYTSGHTTLYAIPLDTVTDDEMTFHSWTVGSPPESMIAANGKLFVSTRDGSIHCYTDRAMMAAPPTPGVLYAHDENAVKRARETLAATGVRQGYCLALGLKDGELIRALARESELHVIAIDSDAQKVARIRKKLDGPCIRDHVERPGDMHGRRISVICADPATVKLPPYFASLVVSEDVTAGGYRGGPAEHLPFVRQVARVLRPYGGTACFPEQEVGDKTFAGLLRMARIDDVRLHFDDKTGYLLPRRVGPLKGAAEWTHQYADAANSVVSKDERVKLPLGVLWFGGPTHDNILPRHGHGPVEHVVGGRLFIEGPDTLRASDVYTGRVLWEKNLPEIGKAYDNTYHQPGANAIGSNFASARDAIYLIHGDNCLRIDPVTGNTLSVLTVPARQPGGKAMFGFVSVSGDVLVTGVTPLVLDWDPVFRKGQFRHIRREKRLGKMVAIIEGWEGGPLVPRTRGQTTLDFVLENFNAILNERSLHERVPVHVFRRNGFSEKALDVRGRLSVHLLTRGEPSKYDTALRALNRELLEQLYPTIPRKQRGDVGWFNWDHTSSREIVALDRHTGKVRWRQPARLGFRHNTIVSGGGKVFAIDALPSPVIDTLKRRGETPKEKPRLLAFDLATGDLAWSEDNDVFGTWLGYSTEHDVLVQSGRASRDMLWGEPDNSMSVHRAGDGSSVWKRDRWHHGPVMLHGRKILTQSDGYDLLTGDEVTWANPLTGVREEWRYRRMYGCNSPIASRHLLSFRSAAAGFYDLAGMGGTGNLGGFKSGCSSNLIAADGVLNAPDYTRTCICSYQNQTSLAFVHMPEVEVWTFNPFKVGFRRIERLGINLGAPGDRREPNGTLWLEYPVVGGPSPDVQVETAPDEIDWYYRHSLRLAEGERKWVAASGAKGIRKLTVTLSRPVSIGGMPVTLSFPRRYTVRLTFAEPDGCKPGERIFDVWVAGKKHLERLDVSALAHGPDRTLVREIQHVRAHGRLEIALEPTADATVKAPILSGVEIVAEDW